jgi:hypothetical protein
MAMEFHKTHYLLLTIPNCRPIKAMQMLSADVASSSLRMVELPALDLTALEPLADSMEHIAARCLSRFHIRAWANDLGNLIGCPSNGYRFRCHFRRGMFLI